MVEASQVRQPASSTGPVSGGFPEAPAVEDIINALGERYGFRVSGAGFKPSLRGCSGGEDSHLQTT